MNCPLCFWHLCNRKPAEKNRVLLGNVGMLVVVALSGAAWSSMACYVSCL